ncbi:hypothetical protein AAFF_G00127090 [Aldrovandia affinis]|uniref:Uncharacterized protein n=1 Tax=Aldrovandia affinis TaxID=143900 RepID=A0AAD7T121_9TELE|nr:hypothetical protein AAFF_G00127090 [Aldrovandia affinis]
MASARVPANTQPKLVRYSRVAQWEPYLAQLQLAAHHCGWSEGVTATHLALALEGPALQILLDLDATDQGDLKALTTALAGWFGQRRSTQASWKGGESWGTVAADVRFHTGQGYPSFGAAEQEELALHAFLQALSLERLRQHVILATPHSLDEALKEVARVEDLLCLAPGQTARVRDADCYEEEEEVRWACSPPQQRRQRPPWL